MKLALIPPLIFVEDHLKTDYQLVLPQLLYDDDYVDTMEIAERRGDFLILDNGAAESEEFAGNYLIDMAVELGVDELCIPDVLADANKTFLRFNQFFKDYEELLAVNAFSAGEGQPSLGFVAQGKTAPEAMRLVYDIMNGHWAPYVTTVYLPRLLVRETGLREVRIELAKEIRSEFGDRLNIHLFGTAPEWPSEANRAREEAPFIRGIDTSMPYSWAFRNLPQRSARVLGGGASIWDSDNQVHRPDNYFDSSLAEDFDEEILNQNIKVMGTWTGNIL